jgi:hypothetical protein
LGTGRSMRIVVGRCARHDCAMGRKPADYEGPDLFSNDTVRDAFLAPKPSATESIGASLQRYLLPKNLSHALTQLTDGEFDLLHAAMVEEMKRRRRPPKNIGSAPTPSFKRRSDLVSKTSSATRKSHSPPGNSAEASLTTGQVNAVRAAFKAGITPLRIARQFGISQRNVQKALAPAQPNE